MKKIILFLTIFAVGVGVYLSWEQVKSAPAVSAVPAVTASPTQVPVVIELPEKLTIPKLKVETMVEAVGMEPSGRMGVPSSAHTVGWWQHGVRPGEVGSAVLAGHLDSPEGEPGVFYNLTTLEIGDLVIVTDQSGRKHEFAVTGQEMYKDATFPIESVFLSHSGRNLNLITCSGTFDQKSKNYDKRVVVFTKLRE